MMTKLKLKLRMFYVYPYNIDIDIFPQKDYNYLDSYFKSVIVSNKIIIFSHNNSICNKKN